MKKIGRNDPCPCGSGKKYKKCCMNKEKTDTALDRYKHLQSMIKALPDLFMEYNSALYGEEGVETALSEFVFSETLTMEPSSPWLGCFFNHYVYFWYPEPDVNAKEPDNPFDDTVAARFLNSNRKLLSPTLKNYIHNTMQEPITFWEVIDVKKGEGMVVRDLILDRTLFVYEITGSENIVKWDIIFGFIGGVDDIYLWNAVGPYPLPAKLKPWLVEIIEDNFKGLDLTKIELKDYDYAILEIYSELVEVLFNPELPELFNTDGDKLVLTTSYYEFPVKHKEAILEKFRNMRNMSEVEPDVFNWAITKNPEETTIKGTITISRTTITTECNSTRRDRILKQRLLRNFSDILEHKHTEKEKDFVKKAMSSPPPDMQPMSLDEMEPELRAAIEEKMESVYMDWADMTVPALDGQTPREAVKTKAGRQRVIELIREHENLDARNPNPQYRFDFDKLRRELGLTEEL